MVHSTDGGQTLTIRLAAQAASGGAVRFVLHGSRRATGRVSMYIYRDQVNRKMAGVLPFPHDRWWPARGSEAEHEQDEMTPAGGSTG